jgi:hypothetical protein
LFLNIKNNSMLDQIVKLVQQHGGDAIMNNAAIPADKKPAVVNEVAEQISGGLQRQFKSGNIQDVLSMFNTGGASLNNNPVVSSIISSVVSSLSSKFGISPQISQQIANSILPKIMGQFVSKTNDPKDSDFDLQDMVKNFTGKSNVADLIGSVTGSGNDRGLGGALGKMFN